MKGQVEIVRATENELAAVANLVYLSILYHQPLDSLTVVTDATKASVEKESLRRLTNPQYVSFLAKNEHGFCGVVTAFNFNAGVINSGKKMLRIEDLFVKEEYRRRGIAQLLFEACSAYAVQNEIDTVTLNVLSNNECAVAFYKHMGFEVSAYKMIKQL
jgi:ribosomal protein S18 acetylase RimI-like enzyme